MQKNWYREALEALGMKGDPVPIHNKLNAVAAHTEDEVLRELTLDVIHQFKQRGRELKNTCIRDSHGVKHSALELHCLRQVGLGHGP